MTATRQESTTDPSLSAGRVRFATDPRQVIKIVVYGLLLVNFGHYVAQDIEAARHEFHAGWGLIEWSRAFATTLDETAWFLLLFLLELETYLLSDEAFTPLRLRLMHGLRIVCYVVIGHTVFASAGVLLDLYRGVEHSGVNLCSFAGSGLSYTFSQEYWDLTSANCSTLSADSRFYQIAQQQVLTDSAGMSIEWQLAWLDQVEVVVWLLILLMIEIMVRLQEKGVTKGPALRFARSLNALLYSLLWIVAAWWVVLGHYVFAWDEALWILGFMAIGMNLSDWRKEIDDETGLKP